MTSTSIPIQDERRERMLDKLQEEEGAKTEGVRALLDLALNAHEAGLVSGDQTTIEALHELVQVESAIPSVSDGQLTADTVTNQLAELSLGHNHAVSPTARDDWDDLLANTHRERLPVLEAWLNHRSQVEGWELIDDKATLVSLITSPDTFGASKTTAENYIEKLADAGVIHLHPKCDPRIWNKDFRTKIRLQLAGEHDAFSSLDQLSHVKQKAYGVPITDVFEPISTFREFQGENIAEVYLDDAKHREVLWNLISKIATTIARFDLSKTASPGRRPTGAIVGAILEEGDHAKAWHYLLRRILSVSNDDGIWESSEYEMLSELDGKAMAASGPSSDEFGMFAVLRAEIDRKFEFAEVSGQQSSNNSDMSRQDAVQWLQIEDEQITDEVVDQAYHGRVKEEHPDISDHENAEERFKAILDARQLLQSD